MDPARRGLLLLTLLGALCACDKPQGPVAGPAPPPAAPEAVLSGQQAQQRALQCESKARAHFQADSKQATAEFAHHYHRKLDTCFYMVAVTRDATRTRKLLDIFEDETYGEYLGLIATADAPPWRMPDTCRVFSFYCGSEGEWEVLVRQFMED
jgi:hypothetical protein